MRQREMVYSFTIKHIQDEVTCSISGSKKTNESLSSNKTSYLSFHKPKTHPMICVILHLVLIKTSCTIDTNHFQYTPRLFANNRCHVLLITNEDNVKSFSTLKARIAN